ncbi:hypothetical protein SLE2022_031570 [Rubroshorea leprosula]
MSILYWNIQGTGNPAFLSNVNDLVDRFNPFILVFFETCVNRQRTEAIIQQVVLMVGTLLNQWALAEGYGCCGAVICSMFPSSLPLDRRSMPWYVLQTPHTISYLLLFMPGLLSTKKAALG